MANTSPNFESILNQAPTEVDRPKPLPAGTYLCTIGMAETGESSKKKTPFVMFPLNPIAPQMDVDEAALEEAGGLEGKRLSITFYITQDAVFMLDEFHQNALGELDPSMTRFDRNDAVVNQQVLAVVEHEIDQNDSTRVYTRVRRTARAD